MIDDKFFSNFMESDPSKAKGPVGLENKPVYSRAEVDQIIQDTIKSTLNSIYGQGHTNDPAGDPEQNFNDEEDNANGSEENGNEGEGADT